MRDIELIEAYENNIRVYECISIYEHGPLLNVDCFKTPCYSLNAGFYNQFARDISRHLNENVHVTVVPDLEIAHFIIYHSDIFSGFIDIGNSMSTVRDVFDAAFRLQDKL